MNSTDFKFILVGGIGRSGTSILSKTLATTKNSEFFYEPPVFMHFLESLTDLELNSYDWKSLLECMLYKDLMKGAVSGRALNFNRHDISSVYNYKSKEEILERYKGSFSQRDLKNRIAKSNGIIKVLDAIFNFNKLERIIPGIKAVIVVRHPIDVARSIQSKGWFSDESLKIHSEEHLRLMKVVDDFRFPLFLNSDEYLWWRQAGEIDRIAKYCNFHLKAFEKLIPNQNVSFVKYDDLINKPGRVIEGVLGQLNLEKGTKTDKVLDTISLQSRRNEEFERRYSDIPLGTLSIENYYSLIDKL